MVPVIDASSPDKATEMMPMETTSQPGAFRPESRFLQFFYPSNKVFAVTTDCPIDEELWLVLRHAAEVKSAGIDLIRFNQPGLTDDADLNRTWEELRAYLRQAETFYRGAKVLPWKSSPLNFYYAFLNLAKASCLLGNAFPAKKKSELDGFVSTPRKVRHGVSENILIGSPDDIWELRVQKPTDVFGLFYKLSVGQEIAEGALLEGHDLLGYVRSIGWQLSECGYREKTASFGCRWALAGTPESAWDVIGIPNVVQVGLLPAAFLQQYEPVTFPTIKNFARRVFNLSAADALGYAWFQRRIPYPTDDPEVFNAKVVLDDIEKALAGSIFWDSTTMGHQFLLCMPCRSSVGDIPMNEEMATYSVLYFLSSLVRYHPEYMDSIAASTDAWLIESFVNSAPLTLLRTMAARIVGQSIVMRRS